LILGALVLGVVYIWKYQPHRLPGFHTDKLDHVGTELGKVGGAVEEKLRATKIKGAVKAALELNRSLSAYSIDVDAHDDGSVVVAGEVPTEDARAAAARVAAGVPDVARVDNQLRVNPALGAPSSEGRSLGENFDDHALEAKVKLAFSLNKDMKGSDVTVSAFRREVTLGGTVTSDAQRQLALQIAQQTAQVGAVKDAMQVGAAAPAGASPAPRSDAAAAGGAAATGSPQAVQAALAANANLAPFHLVAQAQGGRIVVSGRVRTGAEKDLAGMVARGAAGAAVQNNVIVQP